MKKKILLSLCLTAPFLAGCYSAETITSSKRSSKMRHIIYRKDYPATPSGQENADDKKHFDSVSVYQKPVGKEFHDTFTKERGQALSSHYNPSDI